MLNRTGYTILATALAPVAVARLLLLSRKHSGYSANIGQRFGRIDFSTSGSHCLWLHAVSVGEVIASEPFVNRLLQEYPDFSICITNTTPTGAEQVRRSFAHWGARVHQTYAPYDLPGSVERFLDQLRPVGLVMMETELSA
ncbi:MAG: glycosyltransferase N-terminal domain-containing protein [Porticoccaceae bacterium]